MVSIGWHRRAGAVLPAARLATLVVASVLVAACAAPGAVSTPTPSAGRYAGGVIGRRAQFGAIRQRCGHGPQLRD